MRYVTGALVGLLLLPSIALAEVVLRLNVAEGEEQARLNLRWETELQVEVEVAPREVFLRFDQGVDASAFDDLSGQLPDWVAWASVGYDSILIHTARPVAWTRDQATGSLTLILSEREDSPGTQPEAGETNLLVDGSRLRLRRLRARLAAEEGALRVARQKQDRLVAQDPLNPSLIGDRALTESRLGLGWSAAASHHRALAAGGDPADYAAPRARLLRDHGARIRLSLDRQVVRDADRQWITRLEGRDTFGPRANWGLRVEGRQVSAPAVVRVDGRTTPVDFLRERAALWAESEAGRTGYLRGTMARASGHTGGALRYRHRLDRTRLEGRLAVEMPLWEYVTGIVDEGRNDSIELAVEHWREGRWQVRLATGPRRYHLQEERDLARSWKSTVQLRHWLEQQPEVSLGYSLDHEAVRSRRDPVGPNGPYRPLEVTDSRIHSLDVGVGDILTDFLRYNATLGVSIDRPNEAYGPFLQGNLRYQPTPRLEAGVSILHADGTYRGQPAVLSRLGLYVMVHPWP